MVIIRNSKFIVSNISKMEKIIGEVSKSKTKNKKKIEEKCKKAN